MTRSEINALIKDAKTFFATHGFHLPPWAHWEPSAWKGKSGCEVVEHQLGWDLTDYGGGEFERKGLILFTLRNGSLTDGTHPQKPYAEKIMIVREGQVCPMHFHWTKVEDIINRGGGNLRITLHGSDSDGELTDAPVTVSVDGFERIVPSGECVVLTPGESITLTRGMYHAFTGEGGKVLVGEVSSVNDDHADNRFHEPQPRFPAIEENEEPLHLLVGDYGRWT